MLSLKLFPAMEAALLTYNTRREKFDSLYERNKFYRGLFGYTQTVKKNGKKYEYEKDGLMDSIPNARIDDSVFIMKQEYVDKVREYFSKWEEKVSYHVFTVVLEDKSILEKIKDDTR